MRSLDILCIIAAVAVSLAWPIVASADDQLEVVDFGPGQDGYLPDEGSHSPPWMGLAFGLLALAVILAPAFKNARRTHLN